MIDNNDKPQHTKPEDLAKEIDNQSQKKSQYATLITNSLDTFLETEDPIHTVRKEVRKAMGITDEYIIVKNESKNIPESSINNDTILLTKEKNTNDCITIDLISKSEQKTQGKDTIVDVQMTNDINQTNMNNTMIDSTNQHENITGVTMETETNDQINIINDTKNQIQITENKIDEIESVLKEIAEITSSSNINEEIMSEINNDKKIAINEKILNEEITDKKATPYEMTNNQNTIENDTFEGTQTVFRKKKKEIIRRKTLTVADTAEFTGENTIIENNVSVEAKNEITNDTIENTNDSTVHTTQDQTETTKNTHVESVETSHSSQIFTPTQNNTEEKTSWCCCFRWCRK